MHPSEDEVVTALVGLRQERPSLGFLKVYKAVKQRNPTWTFSKYRLRKVMRDHALDSPAAREADMDELTKNLANIGTSGDTELKAAGTGVSATSTRQIDHPHIPKENALERQETFFQTSPRDYLLYGRAKYDYALTFNANIKLLFVILLKRMIDWIRKRPNPPQSEKLVAATCMPTREMFDQLYAGAKKAGISREDLGLQLQAEYGVNPVPHFPPLPVTQLEKELAALQERYVYKKGKIEMIGKERFRLDSHGEVIWDEQVEGRFATILTKMDRATGKECGDI